MRTAPTRTASPVAGSVSTATPQRVAGPDAGSNRADGIFRKNRVSGSSLPMPMTEIVVAGHPDIAHVGGAAGHDA